jgi:multidrug efflux pump subunit AcrB
VMDNIKSFLPLLHKRGRIPDDVEVEVAFDQSQYVRDALGNLRLEAVLGAVLASLVVLLFLGSLRSACIVALSIPLSILAALLGLYFTGHTLNIMTLGGLALILGRVVDDSIVDVENTVRHLNMGKDPLTAARDSAAEISVPVFMATLTTVVVFFPLMFMSGIGKDLFTPLAVSATLAMVASYVISRTVSPLYCSKYLQAHDANAQPSWSGLFDRAFEKCADVYDRVLRFGLRRRLAVVGLLLASMIPAGFAFTQLGQEFFPEVDASEFTVHLRARGGPRVEVTEEEVLEIDRIVRDVVPSDDLELTLGNIGLSSRWSAVYTPNNGPHAALLRVQLRSGFTGRSVPTLEYVQQLRQRLGERFPGDDFFFETGGMIRGILNAGAVAPVEIRVHGRDMAVRRAVSRMLDARITHVPQVSDTYMPQGMDLPQLRINVDRVAASRLHLTETDATRNVIAALMSSAQLAPNFWIDPISGNPYIIGVQYPEHLIEDMHTLENIPLSPARGSNMKRVPLLRDVARIERTQAPVEVYHYDLDRVSQILVNVSDNDLAGVAADIERIVADLPLQYAIGRLPAAQQSLADDEDFRRDLSAYLRKPHRKQLAQVVEKYAIDPAPLRLPADVRATVHGEVRSMRDSFGEMAFNLSLAVLLVYLVMAAQFSSWIDPLIMIVAAPLGLIGVALLLWATGSSLNVQSLMGVMLMIGISVSNSVLLVEFANRQRDAGVARREAIAVAARTRLRPIVMTTIATVAGLLPMATHLHPGDEMNLPLARAVIGGLLGSTLLTLFVVPVLYLIFSPRAPRV